MVYFKGFLLFANGGNTLRHSLASPYHLIQLRK